MFDTARPGLSRDRHVTPLGHSGYPDGHEAPLWRWLLFLGLVVCSIAAFAQWHYGWGCGLAFLAWVVFPRRDGAPGERRHAPSLPSEAVTAELPTDELSPEEWDRYRAIVRRLGR